MTVEEAVVAVLAGAQEPLHWTVIQDRALRTGGIDPLEVGDVRGAVLAALRDLVAAGRALKVDKGVYALSASG